MSLDSKVVKYQQSKDVIKRLHEIAFKVSSLENEIEKYTDRSFYAVDSLSNSVLLVKSLIQILPDSRSKDIFETQIDYRTVCTLTRNIIDNYIFFFYNCNDSVSKKEINFRIKLSLYHGLRESHRIKRKVSSVSEWDEWHSEKNVEEIKNHPFFKTFDPKKQKSILRGKKAFYLSKKEIVSRIGFNTTEFNALYKYLSNEVHSYAHSSNFAAFDFIYSLGYSLQYSKLNQVLDTLIKFMALTLADYRKRFTRFSDQIIEAEKKLVDRETERKFLFQK